MTGHRTGSMVKKLAVYAVLPQLLLPVSTSHLLRVALVSCVAFVRPTPISLLQLAFTTFSFFPSDNASNTITLLLPVACIPPRNLTALVAFLRRLRRQGYP